MSPPSGKHFKTKEAALTPGRRMLEKIQVSATVWRIGTLCTVDGNVNLWVTMGNSRRLLKHVELESPDDPAVPGLGVCPPGNWAET